MAIRVHTAAGSCVSEDMDTTAPSLPTPSAGLETQADLVNGTCLRILGDREDAADVTQEVMLRCLRQPPVITGPPAAWFHTTARLAAIDWLRRRSARQRAERGAAQELIRRSASSPDPWDEVRPHLDAALGDLPADDRALLIGYHLEGREQTALAQEQALDQGTISRRLAKARERLRELLLVRGVPAAALAVLVALPWSNLRAECPAAVQAAWRDGPGAGTATGPRWVAATVAGTVVVLALAQMLASGHLRSPELRNHTGPAVAREGIPGASVMAPPEVGSGPGAASRGRLAPLAEQAAASHATDPPGAPSDLAEGGDPVPWPAAAEPSPPDPAREVSNEVLGSTGPGASTVAAQGGPAVPVAAESTGPGVIPPLPTDRPPTQAEIDALVAALQQGAMFQAAQVSQPDPSQPWPKDLTEEGEDALISTWLADPLGQRREDLATASGPLGLDHSLAWGLGPWINHPTPERWARLQEILARDPSDPATTALLSACGMSWAYLGGRSRLAKITCNPGQPTEWFQAVSIDASPIPVALACLGLQDRRPLPDRLLDLVRRRAGDVRQMRSYSRPRRPDPFGPLLVEGGTCGLGVGFDGRQPQRVCDLVALTLDLSAPLLVGLNLQSDLWVGQAGMPGQAFLPGSNYRPGPAFQPDAPQDLRDRWIDQALARIGPLAHGELAQATLPVPGSLAAWPATPIPPPPTEVGVGPGWERVLAEGATRSLPWLGFGTVRYQLEAGASRGLLATALAATQPITPAEAADLRAVLAEAVALGLPDLAHVRLWVGAIRLPITPEEIASTDRRWVTHAPELVDPPPIAFQIDGRGIYLVAADPSSAPPRESAGGFHMETVEGIWWPNLLPLGSRPVDTHTAAILEPAPPPTWPAQSPEERAKSLVDAVPFGVDPTPALLAWWLAGHDPQGLALALACGRGAANGGDLLPPAPGWPQFVYRDEAPIPLDRAVRRSLARWCLQIAVTRAENPTVADRWRDSAWKLLAPDDRPLAKGTFDALQAHFDAMRPPVDQTPDLISDLSRPLAAWSERLGVPVWFWGDLVRIPDPPTRQVPASPIADLTPTIPDLLDALASPVQEDPTTAPLIDQLADLINRPEGELPDAVWGRFMTDYGSAFHAPRVLDRLPGRRGSVIRAWTALHRGDGEPLTRLAREVLSGAWSLSTIVDWRSPSMGSSPALLDAHGVLISWLGLGEPADFDRLGQALAGELDRPLTQALLALAGSPDAMDDGPRAGLYNPSWRWNIVVPRLETEVRPQLRLTALVLAWYGLGDRRPIPVGMINALMPLIGELNPDHFLEHSQRDLRVCDWVLDRIAGTQGGWSEIFGPLAGNIPPVSSTREYVPRRMPLVERDPWVARLRTHLEEEIRDLTALSGFAYELPAGSGGATDGF